MKTVKVVVRTLIDEIVGLIVMTVIIYIGLLWGFGITGTDAEQSPLYMAPERERHTAFVILPLLSIASAIGWRITVFVSDWKKRKR